MLKVTLTIAFLAYAAATAHAQDAPAPAEDVAPDRYQIVFTPDVPADAFLLDSSTGRVWRLTHVTDLKGEPDVWMPMLKVDSESEKLALYAEHGKKAAVAAPIKPSAAGSTKSRQ